MVHSTPTTALKPLKFWILSLQMRIELTLRSILTFIFGSSLCWQIDSKTSLSSLDLKWWHKIGDVKEYQVVRYKDPVKEQCSWSWKKKINSIKCLSVVDYTGRFTICQVSFGNNDREAYTSSLLYLEEGLYFSGDQFVATDSASESDGRFLCSYKNPGYDPNKVAFNNAFREVWTGKENSYQCVGAWFLLLGNNKHKLPYDDHTLILSIQAVHS